MSSWNVSKWICFLSPTASSNTPPLATTTWSQQWLLCLLAWECCLILNRSVAQKRVGGLLVYGTNRLSVRWGFCVLQFMRLIWPNTSAYFEVFLLYQEFVCVHTYFMFWCLVFSSVWQDFYIAFCHLVF